jgi:hypothetical protein
MEMAKWAINEDGLTKLILQASIEAESAKEFSNPDAKVKLRCKLSIAEFTYSATASARKNIIAELSDDGTHFIRKGERIDAINGPEVIEMLKSRLGGE